MCGVPPAGAWDDHYLQESPNLLQKSKVWAPIAAAANLKLLPLIRQQGPDYLFKPKIKTTFSKCPSKYDKHRRNYKTATYFLNK